MFFQSAIERAARETEFARCVADVSAVFFNGFANHGFFHALEIVVVEVDIIARGRFGDAEWKIGRSQRAAFVHDHGPFNGVLQFADVARPVVIFQVLKGGGLNGDSGFVVFLTVRFEKPGDEQGNVLEAVAQRREVDFNRVDAIQEVLAKIATGDHVVDGHVGGANQARVDGDGPVVAQSGHGAVFERGEQLGLERRRQVADFIQKKRAARRDFKTPRAVFFRVGKGAFLVPEKFAFKKAFGYRAEIDADKRFGCAGRSAVQGAGNDIFAGAVFAQDEHIGFGRPHLLDGVEHRAHGGRGADQAGELTVEVRVELFALCPQPIHFASGLAQPRSRRERGEQFLVLPRLEHEIGRAFFDGLHRGFNAAVRRDENDHRRGIDVENATQPVKPLFARRGVSRKVHVEQDRVIALVLQQVGDLVGIGFGIHASGVLFQKQPRGQQNIAVVIDDENFVEGFHNGLRYASVPLHKPSYISGSGSISTTSPSRITTTPVPV